MSAIDIQQFQFFTGDIDYVLINIAVGERNTIPNNVVASKLRRFRKESNLCKVLTAAGIPCDIMPSYVNDFNGSAIQINGQDLEVKIEEMDAEIEDAVCTGQCNVDELRSELVDANLVEDGPSLADFGFGMQAPEPKFRARSLTTNEMDNRMKALDDVIKHPFD